ncbi:TD and POZ domain-containing protein 1 [Araneus ventricosus]|uniref:TD and POZ domain-containing protein 1 n=1 Tax=Araneus ventricosus TaxID=182803 RepID=A0A4Y2A8U8_ARAVE|nr:TD and POZ domain-containing protein 1 [Araneus ventricosus]
MSTQDKRKCFTFTWTVENISYCWLKAPEYFESPTFVINAPQESEYSLQLHPRGHQKDNYIGFYLMKKGNRPPVRIDCEIAFLAKDGSVLASTEYTNCTICAGNGDFKERTDVFVANRSAYLPEDKLTARCRIWKSDGDMTEDVHLFARTRICIKKDTFLWDIQNFSSLHSEQKCTYQIKSVVDNEMLMTLDLSLKNPYTDEDSITIQLVSKNGKIKYFVLHLMPLNGFGSADKGIRKEFLFCENKKSKLFTLPFSKKNLMANKNICLPNDVLSLQCECTFSTGVVIEEIESVIHGKTKYNFSTSEMDKICLDYKNALSVSQRILSENLRSLFKDNILSDIKVKTSSETFQAHKSILSARSPVFKAMFSNNMKEKYNKSVDIEDMDSDTVHKMLQYIYTAEIKDLQFEGAYELYRASDQYEILALRDECSAYLKSNLKPNNACEVLILADLHQDEDLKTSVQDFIFNHDIINSEEWKQLMKTNVKLAADTMHLQIQRKALSMYQI